VDTVYNFVDNMGLFSYLFLVPNGLLRKKRPVPTVGASLFDNVFSGVFAVFSGFFQME
jgi:hypothetical protein